MTLAALAIMYTEKKGILLLTVDLMFSSYRSGSVKVKQTDVNFFRQQLAFIKSGGKKATSFMHLTGLTEIYIFLVAS